MKKPQASILKYWVSIGALLVVLVQFILVNTASLSKWKGGGFGMYSEVHYYYNDITINDLNKPLDSLIIVDKSISHFVMDVKRLPNTGNLKKMAELASKYVSNDTVTIQVWKPLVNSKNSTYSRELVNTFQFVKP